MQTIKFVIGLLLAIITVAVADIELLEFFHDPSPQIQLKSRKTTAQRIAEHGYPAETHRITTKDGYIVTTFRIPYSHKLQNQATYRPIAFLQHGLFSCSDAWVLNGPDNGLPFLLADAGFDVWLGNGRGTTYSRNHTTLSTKVPYFWRFSWHEIGYYDLPAMIDYALQANGQGQQSIHYVGHSQGTTAAFVMLSKHPDFNAKMKTVHMFAPVAFMSNMESKLVRKLAPYLGHYNKYSRLFGNQEFVPYNDLFIRLGYNVCGEDIPFPTFCTKLAYWYSDADSLKRTNTTALPSLAETHPAGASTDQILHYMQEQQSGCFCEFDFGIVKNLQHYGRATPPDYPVNLITAELHLWYSDNDDMADVSDVEKLAGMLPNKIMHHMDDPTWDHGNFAMHWEVRKYVNEPVIQIMQNYENSHRK